MQVLVFNLRLRIILTSNLLHLILLLSFYSQYFHWNKKYVFFPSNFQFPSIAIHSHHFPIPTNGRFLPIVDFPKLPILTSIRFPPIAEFIRNNFHKFPVLRQSFSSFPEFSLFSDSIPTFSGLNSSFKCPPLRFWYEKSKFQEWFKTFAVSQHIKNKLKSLKILFGYCWKLRANENT